MFFQVCCFSFGMMEVFKGLEDWQKYVIGQCEEFLQLYCFDWFFIVFCVVGWDVNCEFEGFVMIVLFVFWWYVKVMVLFVFIVYWGGFEEWVVKSD